MLQYVISNPDHWNVANATNDTSSSNGTSTFAYSPPVDQLRELLQQPQNFQWHAETGTRFRQIVAAAIASNQHTTIFTLTNDNRMNIIKIAIQSSWPKGATATTADATYPLTRDYHSAAPRSQNYHLLRWLCSEYQNEQERSLKQTPYAEILKAIFSN